MSNGIDWEKIKEIICGIVKQLQSICDEIPDGSIKNIICGIVGILELICENLPS